MPLALILASSWLELLTFRELANEIGESLDILESGLRDLPERQRSVRATFEYSWGRLADEEQTIFSRLAIFRGGFSRRAAQQVAGAGLRDLRILLEKSLITAEGPDRYAVHELLRQFAEEKLEAAGQAGTIRDAHSRYYLQALAEKEIDLKGRRQLEALWEIEVDLGNVRAAWDYALDAGNWQEIDVALEGLSLYHYIHSKNQDGWSLLTRALAQLDTLQTTGSGDAGATSKRLAPQAEEWAGLWARLVSRAGMLQAQFATSAPESERELQRSLAIAHDLDDLPQIAHTCLALGHYHSRSSGDYAQAASYFSRSLELYRALGDDFFVAHLLHRVGYALEPLEGLEPFLSYTSQSLALAQQIGDLADAGNALGNLGAAVISKGDYDGAKAYLSDALAIYTQMPHREGMAHNLIHLALLEFLDGQMEQARGWATESYVLAKETVSWVSTAYSLAVLSILATVADCDCEKGRQLATQNQTRSSNLFGDFSGHWSHAAALAGLDRSDEAFRQLQAGLRFCTDGDWQAIITWTLPIFAIIYAQKDQPYRAAELLGLFFNHPMSPLGWAEKWPLLSETQERLEAALGEDGYKAAWDAGRELDLSKTAESLLHDEI
jgi:tetratricopeptide (TPR) repeat protein